MSFTINWDKLPSSGSKKAGSQQQSGDRRPLNFIKFTDGSVHIVRPVGKAYGYYRFWYKPAKKYIIAKVNMDENGNVVETNLEQLKDLLQCDPEQRFAMNVIDRHDKSIKILQGPMSMLQDFAEVSQSTGNKPGSANGGDWRISSTGEGKSRRYKCNFLGATPFSEQELLKIKNPDKAKNEWYVLEQVFKPTPQEVIDKLLGQNTTPAAKKVVAAAAEPTEGEPVQVGAVEIEDDLDF